MSDIERELSEVLTERSNRARVSGMSVSQVRMLSRRRTRRRGLAGASVLVVGSMIGIGALLARSPEPQRVSSATGSASSADPPSASFDARADIWRCVGPASLPEPAFVLPSTVAVSTTNVDISTQTSTRPTFPMSGDNYYYMTGCEPVDNVALEAVGAAIPDSVASTTSDPNSIGPSTTVAQEPISTGADSWPSTTSSAQNLPITTTTVVEVTVDPIAFCLLSSNDPPKPKLVLSPDCWPLLQQQADTQRLVDNIRMYVEGVGGYELYVVKSGDYLYGIAQSYGIDVQRLADANGGRLDMTLGVGQPLLIPLT